MKKNSKISTNMVGVYRKESFIFRNRLAHLEERSLSHNFPLLCIYGYWSILMGHSVILSSLKPSSINVISYTSRFFQVRLLIPEIGVKQTLKFYVNIYCLLKYSKEWADWFYCKILHMTRFTELWWFGFKHFTESHENNLYK